MNSQLRVNGKTYLPAAGDATESLLRWLQRQGLTGSKEGCGDGDCGACTVVLFEQGGDGQRRAVAVNSCLLPVGQVVGRELMTVEGLADGACLHPVQQAMVDEAGSQCGYCTPGFVMSMAAGWCEGELGDATIEGNLCRCTGYAPIRRALASLATTPMPADDRLARLRAVASAPAASGLGVVQSPQDIAAALALKAAHPDHDWIAGATDLGVELSRYRARAPGFIALDRIAELQQIAVDERRVRIGAGVPLARIERELHGVLPALDEMLPWFAGGQVKNRATVGGNLGSASPIGDLLPVLMAVDADIELAGPGGRRTLPVADFFTGYRRTRRADDELIVAVEWVRRSDVVTASSKVSKRPTDDISIVAASFALARAPDGTVSHARLAYGGVAAVPLRARAVEDWLLGKALDEATVAEARRQLAAAFTPLSDARAGADYRRALAGNLFARFVAERLA